MKSRTTFWSLRGGVTLAIVVAFASCTANGSSGKQVIDEVPTTRELAKTVVAGVGDVQGFSNFVSVESKLGWRVLRSDDRGYELVQQGGLIRTYAEIGLPRLEQHYAAQDHEGLIELVQEPEAYRDTRPASAIDATIGDWTGYRWHTERQVGFVFESGQRIHGQGIRVIVTANAGYAETDLERFVQSLHF